MPASLWLPLVAALALAAATVRLTRSSQLHPLSAAWWLLLALLLAVLGLFPGILEWLALKSGTAGAPVLLILAVLILKMLETDIARSRERQRNRVLAQKASILEAKLRKLEQRIDSEQDHRL